MPKSTAIQAPPSDVGMVFDGFPADARACLLQLRDLVLDTARQTPAVGPITETLKWGEPSYLTEATKSGTTIRLAWKALAPGSVSLFVNCQTTLIAEWRSLYDGELEFHGNREIRLDPSRALPRAALAHCVAMALTYHARKRSS